MALRNMVYIGDDTLRKRAKEVTDFGERTNMLIDDMWDTMKSKNGLGLAAPQVGILRRIAIINVPAAVNKEDGAEEDGSEGGTKTEADIGAENDNGAGSGSETEISTDNNIEKNTENSDTKDIKAAESDKKHGKYELINPVLLESDGEICLQEGCLSVPEKLGKVKRPTWVKVLAQDRNGEEFTFEGEDMLARAICHELDHLNGVLFVDIAEEIEDLNEN